jgi:stress response protein SCP2
MTSMTKGANLPLTVSLVRATLFWSGGDGVPDVDASALLLRADGKVGSDDDFVFYNQPADPSGRVKHAGKQTGPASYDVLDIDLAGLPAEVERVALAASAAGGTFGQVPQLRLVVSDLAGGTELATFPMSAGSESAFVTGEFYRRGDGWKFRAVGQGWDSGLAGLARDFGIDVGGETDLAPDATRAEPQVEPAAAAPVLPPPSFDTAPQPAAMPPPPPVTSAVGTGAAPAANTEPATSAPAADTDLDLDLDLDEPPAASTPLPPPPQPPDLPQPPGPPGVRAAEPGSGPAPAWEQPGPSTAPPPPPTSAPPPPPGAWPPPPPSEWAPPPPSATPPPPPVGPPPTEQFQPAPPPPAGLPAGEQVRSAPPPPAGPPPPSQQFQPPPTPVVPGPRGDGPVRLERGQRVALAGPSGPLRRITLDLAWQPAPGRLSIDLDTSVIAFDASAEKLAIVWYQHQNEFAGALQHGGDARGEGEQAAERIYIDLERMPAQVDALVFTINSFHGQTFTDLSRASALVSDDNGVQLVSYDLTDTQPSTAVLMAIVRRVEGGAWQMRAIGEYHDCRTVKKLVDPAARQVGLR